MQEVPSAASAAVAKPFVHQPMQPHISADYPLQRYFSRNGTNHATRLSPFTYLEKPDGAAVHACSDVKVWRHASRDDAELSLSIEVDAFRSELAVYCTAEQMRHIASMLLDAALDLDANPSAVLINLHEQFEDWKQSKRFVIEPRGADL